MLLLSLVYWASGLARFVHERVEHGDRAARMSAAGTSLKPSEHDENDCPVCQALATMRADRPALPVVTIANFDLVGLLIPVPQAAPLSERLFTIQSRGPPVDLA